MRLACNGLILVALLGLGAYFAMTMRSGAPGNDEHASGTGTSETPDLSPRVLESTRDTVSPRAAASRCVVVDEAGIPVAGALALWHSVACSAVASSPTWPRIDWSALEAHVVSATTDVEGRLDGAPLARGSWAGVWIVDALHEAHWIQLQESQNGQLPDRIVLKSAPAWSAHVADLGGHPIPGARVVQLFDLRTSNRLGNYAPPGAPDNPRRWLRLVSETDSAGTADLRPLPGPSWIWCESGGLRSAPWFGTQPAKVEFVLGSAFTLGGKVVSDSGAFAAGEACVRWLARTGTSTEWVDMVDVGPDGSIGPIRVPLIPADKYVFQLVGPGLALDLCEAYVPAADATLSIELHAAQGLSMKVRVLDESAHPVEGARVIVTWSGDGLWRAVERMSDSGGLAPFTEVALMSGYVQVRKAGFVPFTSPELNLQTGEPSTYTVELQPGGTIEGRVTHSGRGVTDFTIYFWQGDHQNMSRHPVANAEDGRFVLDMAALGENSLLATSERHTTSDAVSVRVTREEPAKVELVLPDQVVGHGTIVDARTLQPVSGGSVQSWVSHGRQLIHPWGSPTAADSHGSFEINGLHPGTNLADVSAPGYSTRGLHFQVPPDARRHEFGVIGLLPKSTLVVKLDGPAATNYSLYKAALDGGVYYPDQPFPAEGVLRIESLDPGTYTLSITKPNGDWISQFLRLAGGETLLARVPLHGRSLTVQVESNSTQPLPTGLLLRTAHATAQGRDLQQSTLVPEDGRVEVPCVEGTLLVLTLEDSTGAVLAVKDVELTESGPALVAIRPDDRTRVVRVVNRARKPLQGVTLFTSHLDPSTLWHVPYETDAAGECVLRGITLPRIQAYLYSPALGMCPSVTLDLATGGMGPIELVFDPEHELAIQLFEGTTPLTWINLRVGDSTGIGLGLAEQSTDESGFARWPRVSTGRYVVEVQHPGFWPTRSVIDLVPGAKAQPIQARRVGDLRCVARTNLGTPRDGVAIALRSVDFDTDVKTWIAHGKVAVESGDLVTNERGELLVRGLPVGSYAWSAAGADGESLGGTARVEAGRASECVIE